MAPSPTEVQKALKGADYPASRDDLIELAKDNEAPEDVVDVLEESLEDDEYGSPADVMADMGGSSLGD
jgi:Protein of unknown function (DUF2795)